MSRRRPYDSFLIRQFHRDAAYDAQRDYAAMSVDDQRAYAASHPDFVSTFGNAVPEHVRFAMADAYAASGPEAADAVWDAYIRRRNLAQTASDLARSAMPWPTRLVWVVLFALAFAALAFIACPTAYVAAGPHGATVVGVGLGLTFAVCAAWRLAVGTR